MWLINTRTLALELVVDPKDQEYAILSHTWGDGEVTFHDMENLTAARSKPSFGKIKTTCALALDCGYQYAWVDTCCINKESSAELSEAINSMFQWYRDAAVCFAFLADLDTGTAATVPDQLKEVRDSFGASYDMPVPPAPTVPDNLGHCRWFTRGWTLQELIAPSDVEFYDCNWCFIGTKQSLMEELSAITWIDINVLEDVEALPTVPIARRMSWAARRQTTRQEDMAYCLLGIFDVNMPMIYGEGPKAFLRLQEEIVKENNDLSLFAWCSEREEENGDDGGTDSSIEKFRGLLARSPKEFARCRHLERSRAHSSAQEGEFVLTNSGFRLNTHLAMSQLCEYILNVNCLYRVTKEDDQVSTPSLGIPLTKTPSGFVRVRPHTRLLTLDPTAWVGRTTPVYIHKHLTRAESTCTVFPGTEQSFAFVFETGSRRWAWQSDDAIARPAALWDDFQQLFMTAQDTRFTGIVEFSLTHK
ncbi:heterokaryon incompatibility protein-domain-containing protein, partial [Podospora didyma]